MSPNVCPKDGGPVYVRYDLEKVRGDSTARDRVTGGPKTMWRYSAVLPDPEPVSRGGPDAAVAEPRVSNLLIEDEGLNPTGSFKARGMSAAVTMARTTD